MKKSYIILSTALFAATAFVGCSNDEDFTCTGRYDDNEIGFIAATSRAQVNILKSLQDDKNGFGVYATQGKTPSSFAITAQPYKFDVSSWGWDANAAVTEWPSTDAGYPMNFYAYYPIDNDRYPITAGAATLDSQIEIGASDEQLDLLRAAVSTEVKPSGGKLAINFDHILSRINLRVNVGEGYTVYLQSVKFEGLVEENNYDLVAGAWDDLAADVANEGAYEYLNVKYDGDGEPAIDVLKDNNDSFTATYPDLMLLPHTLQSWTPVAGVAPSEAYVTMVYRMTTDEGADYLGYTQAQSHPDYNESTATVVGGGKLEPTTPLFIKIAVPLKAPVANTWDDGLQYTYVVNLGGDNTNNGYFADDAYYDEDGKETNIPVKHGEIGDDVTESSEICFDVTVSDWDDKTDDFEL